MGIVASWLTGCLFPEEQAIWHAANVGDHRGLHDAIAALTPSTRRYLEWKDPCSGRTPLAQSAAKGRLPCVVALVDSGVNVNAKDYKGNTPLHLASRHGRADVVKYLVNLVQVVPFEANMELQTPLDVARDRLRRRKGCDDHHHSASTKQVVGYEGCIEELEKKFYLYSGWVYEKTDNLLSSVSGISNLSSWKHRFCIVLQRGLPDVLELALFAARKGDMRPALPSSVVLYHVQSGFLETTDSKWFNRKDYAFSITGSVLQRDGHCEERRRAAPTQSIELAAIDAEGFHMWTSFLQHQQEMLAASRLQHGELPTVYASTCGANAAPASAAASVAPPTPPVPVQPAMTDYRAYPADYVAVPRHHQSQHENNSSTMSTLRDDAAEDEDLRRAIELSLRETTSAHETTSSSPRVAISTMYVESSAPAWTDDEGDDGEEQKGEAAAAPPPVVSFSRAPSYSSIGECVVCFDGPQAAVCVPCGHNAVCMSCAEEILETSCECPVCRHPIRELIKLYRV